MPVYSYIGKGKIYLQVRGGSSGLIPIGNCSRLELAAAEEKKDLIDFESAGGGKANSIARVTGVTAAITAHDLSPENLALALRGDITAVSAGSVTDESHTAYHGALVPFANLPDTGSTITVTNTGATTTYVAGTDYTVTRAGIIILATGTITDGQTILVDYTKLASNVVQLLTDSALEYRLVFDGLNEAASGAAVVVTAHRVKFSPAQALGLIGDDFAGLELSAELLKDDSITGAGISQYAKIAMAA